ncbi:MAG: type I restriction enzyme, S subunit [Methyloprofundus sp.]|nr:MAG: type I restriction enzyme, S subunit [Methyloprofundus sp.]
MSKLTTYKFSNLYDMSSGISSKPEQAGHGFPFVSFSTVFNNQFLPETLPNLMDTSEKERKIYSVKEGDIFLTRTSETLDELAMSSVAVREIKNATYSGFSKRLRPTQSDISYHKFMAFYLRSKLFRKTMKNNAIMTLRASLNEQIFSYLDLLLPEYKEQKKIGDYLYLLNQKIELNNKINTELEAMAKLIYDYWFVQFDFPDANGKPYKSSGGKMLYNEALKRDIPDGWEAKKIKEIASTGSGGTPLKSKNEYYYKGDIPWINSGEVNVPFIIKAKKFITKKGMDESSAKLFQSGAILMAMYGATAGKVSFINFPATTNQAICSIIPQNPHLNFYLKFGLEDLYRYLVNLSSGSARDNLSQDKIKELKFSIPSEELLEEYNLKIEPMMSLILLNLKEISELAELRDWLLPMLMNGQVTVKGA